MRSGGYYLPSPVGGQRIIVPRAALAATALISVTEAAVGAIQDSFGGEELLLTVKYTKGSEAGVDVYIKFFDDSVGTTASFDMIGENIGGGLIITHSMKFRLDSTQNIDIPISMRGRQYYRVYQISVGAVGATPGSIVIDRQVTGTVS